MSMHTVNVEIVRFTDPVPPGWVESVLRDAGREWRLVDKLPIFTALPLEAHSALPQAGAVACEIIRTWIDECGRKRCLIDTEHPWGVSTADGERSSRSFSSKSLQAPDRALQRMRFWATRMSLVK